MVLDERVADGTFCSNVPDPVGVMDSIGEVSGGRRVFERGKLVRFSYRQGQATLSQSYARAKIGRERPGTLSIGLNDRISLSPLLRDQAYGSITLQIRRNDHVGGLPIRRGGDG